jgi:hypothetical protein
MHPVQRADNLITFTCRLCRNSRSVNLLDPEGPVQASKRITLYRYCSGAPTFLCKLLVLYGLYDDFLQQRGLHNIL